MWRNQPRSQFPTDRAWNRWNARHDGIDAAIPDSHGYLRTYFHGRQVLSHDLIWMMVYGGEPPCRIQHINKQRSDLRLCNLRLAGISIDKRYWVKWPDGINSVAGVYQDEITGIWHAQFMVLGKDIYRGQFLKYGDAVDAYDDVARKLADLNT